MRDAGREVSLYREALPMASSAAEKLLRQPLKPKPGPASKPAA
jgi:hypothetical protein